MEGDKAHKAPHIHIKIGKQVHAASYELKTGKRIAGKNSTYDKTVNQWIITNQETLLSIWHLMQEGKEVSPYIEELQGN